MYSLVCFFVSTYALLLRLLGTRKRLKVLDVLGEELPCITYDGWGNLTPSGYFKFDLGGLAQEKRFVVRVLNRVVGGGGGGDVGRVVGRVVGGVGVLLAEIVVVVATAVVVISRALTTVIVVVFIMLTGLLKRLRMNV